jgi:hypothetical protein
MSSLRVQIYDVEKPSKLPYLCRNTHSLHVNSSIKYPYKYKHAPRAFGIAAYPLIIQVVLLKTWPDVHLSSAPRDVIVRTVHRIRACPLLVYQEALLTPGISPAIALIRKLYYNKSFVSSISQLPRFLHSPTDVAIALVSIQGMDFTYSCHLKIPENTPPFASQYASISNLC